MDGGTPAGLGRAMAVFLIGLLLLASGAPCTPAAAAALPSASAFDPCRQAPAPAPQCAQIACKTFALPAGASPGAPAAGAATAFLRSAQAAAGRLVRPPLPPPRASMS